MSVLPKLILDTDLGGDIDDLGALALLHALADAGKCEVHGIVSDSAQAPAVSAIQAINRWYGRAEVPVACPERIVETEGYASAVAQLFTALPDPNAAPRLPLGFRQMLADAPDNSIVIATIGWQEQMFAFMQSGPDAVSSLTGIELMRQKVKRVVTMGGRYPHGVSVRGTDPNFEIGTDRQCARFVVSNCPVPMVFVGNEVGGMRYGYATGAKLNELPERHPLKVGYRYFFNHPPQWVLNGWWPTPYPKDRIQPWSIWDQITVYYAATEDHASFTEVRGINLVDAKSHNHFQHDPNGPHVYLVPNHAPAVIAEQIIEPLMLTRPEPAEVFPC